MITALIVHRMQPEKGHGHPEDICVNALHRKES